MNHWHSSPIARSPASKSRSHSATCCDSGAPRRRSRSTTAVSLSAARWMPGLAHDVRLDFIRPGKPVEHAFIESFNDKLRDECLNSHVFTSVAEAQVVLDTWRDDYNAVRPHSALQDEAFQQPTREQVSRGSAVRRVSAETAPLRTVLRKTGRSRRQCRAE